MTEVSNDIRVWEEPIMVSARRDRPGAPACVQIHATERKRGRLYMNPMALELTVDQADGLVRICELRGDRELAETLGMAVNWLVGE